MSSECEGVLGSNGSDIVATAVHHAVGVLHADSGLDRYVYTAEKRTLWIHSAADGTKGSFSISTMSKPATSNTLADWSFEMVTNREPSLLTAMPAQQQEFTPHLKCRGNYKRNRNK